MMDDKSKAYLEEKIQLGDPAAMMLMYAVTHPWPDPATGELHFLDLVWDEQAQEPLVVPQISDDKVN